VVRHPQQHVRVGVERYGNGGVPLVQLEQLTPLYDYPLRTMRLLEAQAERREL